MPVDSANPYSSSATVTVLPLAHSSGPDTTFLIGTQSPMAAVPLTLRGATFTILASTELFAVWTPSDTTTDHPE